MNIKKTDIKLPFEFIFEKFPASLWCMGLDHTYRGGNRAAWRAAGANSLKEFYKKGVFDFYKKLNWTKSKAQEFYDFDEKIIRAGTEHTDIHDVIWQGKEGFMNQAGAKKAYVNENKSVQGLIGIGIPNILIDPKIIYPSNYSEPSNNDQLKYESSIDFNLSNWEIFQKVPASLWCMDRNHVYYCCNIEACRLVGAKSEKEYNGKNIFDLSKYNDWPPDIAKNIYDFNENLLATGTYDLNINEAFPQGKKGPPIYLHGIKVPIFNENGETIAILGAAIVVDPFKTIQRSLI